MSTKTKAFIIKKATLAIIFIICLITLNVFIRSIEPVLTNEMAMGQMAINNEEYVAWNLYNNLRPILIGVYYIGCAATGGFIGWNLVTTIKKIKEDNEGEN